MLFPNKVITFKDSSIKDFVLLLEILKKDNMTVSKLLIKSKMNHAEFVDVLTSLYALNKIKYDDTTGEIIYVDENTI